MTQPDTAPAALRYALHVFAAVNRRMPEAAALAEWLVERACAFGLADRDLPACESRFDSRRRAVSAASWGKLGRALAKAASAPLPDRPDTVRATAAWLAAIEAKLSLDATEAALLGLAVRYEIDRDVSGLITDLSTSRGGPNRLSHNAGLLGLLLAHDPAAIERRLAPEGRLLSGALLMADRHGGLNVPGPLLGLISNLTPPAADIHDQLLGTPMPAQLAWPAFAHLGRDAELAARLLAAALAACQSGVNILLYGPPGTGKTSFAASLAARAGARLHAVAEADGDGGEPSRRERLGGLRLAQRLAVPGRTVLLFDEAEDLFTPDRDDTNDDARLPRVFLHRLLEQGAAPVIWTANDITPLGPAVLRRMTLCLQLRIPDLAMRARLWRELGATHGVALAEPEATRLARLVPAAPAVAASALRATRLVEGDAETAQAIVEGVARAVNGGRAAAPEPEPDPLYDPALINADADLAALTTRLAAADAPRAVSLLLAGPPGSGKTAWAHHLAGRIGLPVLQRRGSDIFDPFVGGTEQNIAAAFAEARERRAFLLFDEADSLLMERADAVRNWEVSQVNEMLSAMESHTLPFACTTNLAERLDRASLRRFLVKLRFGWISAAQACAAFTRFFGLAAPAGLTDLRCLVPADFRLVQRRATLQGVGRDPAALLALLAAETEGRIGGRAPLGFIRAAA